MFGYFGKSAIVAPPPAGMPAATIQEGQLVSQPQPMPAVAAPEAPESIQEPAAEPTGPSENQEINAQLAHLRAIVEAKRGSKEAQIRAVQEMQQKQAAYGRDTTQLRPDKAGYATEAEKLMGGQTGYYKPAAPKPLQGLQGLQGLGALTQDVTTMTNEVTRLTAVVKQLTKDVEAGVVPRSELLKAIKDLQAKSIEAKKLTSELSGWVDNPMPKIAIGIGAVAVGVLIYKYCF